MQMNSKWRSVLSFAGVGAACVGISAIFIILTGGNALRAFAGFFQGIVGSAYNLAEVLVKATPLILAGLGVSVAFKSGFTNIGAEGQLYMGAIASTFIAMYLPGLPAVVMIPLCMAGAFILGGLWAFIPGVLKAKFGISEVINTIMFNYIAINLLGVLVQTVLKDPNGYFPMSPTLPDASALPVLVRSTRLHAGIFIAIAGAVLIYLLIYKTTAGFRMRAVGVNRRACSCAGISAGRNLMLSALISGGMAGIAGFSEVAGLHHKLLEGISPDYGYLAIIVALLGRKHPVGVVAAAVGIAALQVGSLSMQRTANVPSSIASIIMGTLVVLILARKTIFRKLLGKEEGI